MGGLGNQLFIVAAAASYAWRNSMQVVLDDRNFSGGSFSGAARPVYTDSVFSNIPIVPHGRVWGMSVNEDNYDKPPNPSGNAVTAQSTYFQRMPPLFDSDRDKLRKLFKAHDREMVRSAAKLMPPQQNSQTICVHFRFVDSATPSDHSSLTHDTAASREKLSRAMKQYVDEAEVETKFVVFTNHLLQAKVFIHNNTRSYAVTVLDPEEAPDFMQFYAMINFCDGFIAGTSTFVWWAMYLSTKPLTIRSFLDPDPLLDYLNTTYL